MTIKIKLLIINLFVITLSIGQTTFTYSGDGHWNDEANWSPNYPGTVILSDDEVIISNDSKVTINLNEDIVNYGTINNNGKMININGLINSRSFGSGFFINNNSLDNKGTIDNFGTFTNTSELLNSGNLINRDAFSRSTIFTNSGTIQNTGIIDNETQLNNSGAIYNSGKLINTNYTGSINLDGTLVNTGELTGSNSTHNSNFSNQGIMNIESKVSFTGTYNFTKAFEQQATAVLNIDVENRGFDKINAKNVKLNNSILNVNLLSGYIPKVGESYTILAAQSIEGKFGTTNLPSLPDDKYFELVYSNSSIILNVIERLPITYVYSGNGDWSNESFWSPSYPGVEIDYRDTVIVSENSEVLLNTDILISGNIENRGFLSIDENIKITNEGILNNESTLIISANAVLTNAKNGEIRNNRSRKSKIINQSILNNFGLLNSGVGVIENNNFINNDGEAIINVLRNSKNGKVENLDSLRIISRLINDGEYINRGIFTTFVGDIENNALIHNFGDLNPSSRFTNDGTIINDGNFKIKQGPFINNKDIINNRLLANESTGRFLNNGTIENDGRIEIHNQMTNKNLLINNGIIESLRLSTFQNEGVLSGNNSAHIGLANYGELSPGNATSAIGNYILNTGDFHRLEETGLLNIQIDRINADNLEVKGVIDLNNSTLKIELLDEFIPDIGNRYTILNCNSLSGVFGNSILPILPEDRSIEILYNENSVEINIVENHVLSNPDINQNTVNINIYPNPNVKFIHISGIPNVEYLVRIINNLGQVIIEQNMNLVNNGQINVENLEKGIYFLRIQDHVFRFVKGR